MTEYRYHIKRFDRKLKGEAVKVDVYIQGVRYRELLGHNLTDEEAERLAIEKMREIHEGLQDQKTIKPGVVPKSLGHAIDIARQMREHKGCVENDRPESVIKNHLIPFFKEVAKGEHTLMASIQAEHGLQFIRRRRDAGASENTIKREWGVLLRLCNLAESFWRVVNPLKAIPGPRSFDRERIVTLGELEKMRKHADEDTWRFIVASLHVGLRETMMLTIEDHWHVFKLDGDWLRPPKPKTNIKRYLPEIPLNAIATAAIFPSDRPLPTGKVFPWKTRSGVYQAFQRVCDAAGVADLTVHDLKRTFGTWLEEEGVDYEVRQMLLGHKMPGVTKTYSQGVKGGEKTYARLREAVTLLEKAYPLPMKSCKICTT